MDSIGKIISDFIARNGGNMAEIGRKLGISKQRLGDYAAGNYKPKADFYDKVKEVFGEDLQQGVKKAGQNVSRGTSSGEMYRAFFEEQTDYLVMPKIMIEEYELVPKAEQEAKRKLIEEALSASKDLISLLKKNVEDLMKAQELGRGLKTHKPQQHI
jgi:transcriptional regulator with XRE-family HTH domain